MTDTRRRDGDGIDLIWRRRCCRKCGHIFTTKEVLAGDLYKLDDVEVGQLEKTIQDILKRKYR